jgi:hypothetical protein
LLYFSSYFWFCGSFLLHASTSRLATLKPFLCLTAPPGSPTEKLVL